MLTFSRGAVLVLVILGLLVAAGCSMPTADDILPDRKVEYKKQKKAERRLEVPPDLTTSSINDQLVVPDVQGTEPTTYSDYVSSRRAAGQGTGRRGTAVLPETAAVSVKRDGDKRWLVVEGSPEQVWPEVRSFWSENGILLVEEDPVVGIMETGWIENRADVGKDIITDTVRRFSDRIYSTGTRDKYRTRIEKGTLGGTTEIFLTHRGIEEVVPHGGGGTSVEYTVWQPRPADPELEAEMLRRMMVHIGVADASAKRQLAGTGRKVKRAQIQADSSGNVALLINEDFPTAWRLVGVSLDRANLNVEDRDRTEGVYYVRYADPLADDRGESSWLGKLKFWDSGPKVPEGAEFQVRLIDQGSRSRVILLNKDGSSNKTSTAKRILTLIEEQIN